MNNKIDLKKRLKKCYPVGFLFILVFIFSFTLINKTEAKDIEVGTDTDNVGIGTTAPGAYKLNVNGNTYINGTLNINGTITGASLSGTISSANVSSGAFGSNTGGGNYSFPGSIYTTGGINSGYGNTAPPSGGGIFYRSVGIGTANPIGHLDVVGVNQGWSYFRTNSGNPSSAFTYGLGLSWNRTGNDSESNIVFGTSAGSPKARLEIGEWNGATYAADMTVMNGGNVGIGTTAPSAKLEVSGSRNITGADLYGVKSVVALSDPDVNDNDGSYNEYGGYFLAQGNGAGTSYGVYAKTTNDNYYNDSIGVYGDAYNVGVMGRGDSIGLQGIGNSYGVYGYSNTGYGAYGYSNTGFGVRAGSNTGFGLYSYAPKNYFSGSVGIGTDGPGYKLDVQGGQINASGGLCIAGNCKTNWNQVAGTNIIINDMGTTDFNTSFTNTPADQITFTQQQANNDPNTHSPVNGTWYFTQNIRHTNGSNYWGTQLAYGWEDHANRMWMRNVQNGSFGSWYEFITSANIGSQSVNYASSAGSVSSLAGTWWGVNYFGSNKGASSYLAANNTYGLEAYSTDGGAAAMSFHRAGYYAVNFGLDPDNVMRIGGWSVGNNNLWALDMSGNQTVMGQMRASAGANFYGNGYSFTGPGDTDGGMFSPADGTLVFATNNAERVRITPGGYVGIGTTNPGYKLEVAGPIGAESFAYRSDRNLKKNIETIQSPLDKILQLRGVTFNWKKDNSPSVGLIAQEVETVFPELVSESNGIKSVQYGNLVAPLIEAVKAQQTEIQNQQAQINEMRGQIQKLQSKN